MRGTRLSLVALLLGASCAAVSPPATSERPAQNASPAGPQRSAAGAGPVVTQRPAITTTPAPSGSGAAGATTGVATPRPALSLPISNALCSEWPSDVATVMTQLPLPPSICLVRTTSASAGRLLCTVVGCVPVTKGCDDQGQCLQIVDGTSPHYVLVFIRPPASPPPPIGEGYSITRSLCRIHQYRSLSDVILPGAPPPVGGWLSTVEAREFATAFTAFQIGYAADAERWKPQSSDFENYADVCAAWYYPAGRGQRVSDYASLLTFAKKWLPLPQ